MYELLRALLDTGRVVRIDHDPVLRAYDVVRPGAGRHAGRYLTDGMIFPSAHDTSPCVTRL
ncbi:hypothetical protein [Streptomyces thermolilacinus]|uniref:hypothetical protein n=1 Tax=Streptomyces thermolilacinus TaxID=285540 RepID=UPI0033C35BA1